MSAIGSFRGSRCPGYSVVGEGKSPVRSSVVVTSVGTARSLYDVVAAATAAAAAAAAASIFEMKRRQRQRHEHARSTV